MVNHVFSRCKPAALTSIGWVCFVAGTLLEQFSLAKLTLLAVARVLPSVLRSPKSLLFASLPRLTAGAASAPRSLSLMQE
jgi:hypothetical protein